MRTDNLNFRGKYKQYDPDGNSYVYKIGDSVEYKGKLFAAVQVNTDKIPDTKEGSTFWKSLGGVEGFYISETPPTNAKIGDRWWRPSTSILYTYVLENTNRFWVEL
jgi:hypothetical protein